MQRRLFIIRVAVNHLLTQMEMLGVLVTSLVLNEDKHYCPKCMWPHKPYEG